MANVRNVLGRSRRRIQADLDQLRILVDRRFAKFLDFVAESVWVEFDAMPLELDADGNILRNAANANAQRRFLLKSRQIYSDALGEIQRRNPQLFGPYVQGAQRALSSVKRLARDMQDEFIFPPVNMASVESAWGGVGVDIAGYTQNMNEKVTRSVSRHMLLGSPKKQLENELADLSISSDKMLGLSRSDKWHRARARMQIRGEMTRAYTQQMKRSADEAGYTLFEHFGPIDTRNVVRLGDANRRGVVNPRFVNRGSASFISRVLTADQWRSVVPTVFRYGLHYGERGGFQPINPTWPGQSDRWERSQRALGFDQQPTTPTEPDEPARQPRSRRPVEERAEIARTAGVDPRQAEEEARAMLAAEAEVVDRRRHFHEVARKSLGIEGTRRARVTRLVARGADRETLQREGFAFDEVADELAVEYPDMLGRDDPAADLFDIVTQPPPARLTRNDLGRFHSLAISEIQRSGSDVLRVEDSFTEFRDQF